MSMFLVATGCSSEAGTTSNTGNEADFPSTSEGADGGFDSESEPEWSCSRFNMLGASDLVWADASASSGSVTSLSVAGTSVDTSIDGPWTSQVEHWGPCVTVHDGYVGVVLALGPEVMLDAQSQMRIGVHGGVGTYDLAQTVAGAVDDPTAFVQCSSLIAGAYTGGPSPAPGTNDPATGTLEVHSVPTADGEALHITLAGSNGDGFCEYELDVELTVPDGYFAALDD